MPQLIVSIDGVVIKELKLTKERTALGRRPYNDIVIDNLAVSGEHAALHMSAQGVELEDLHSTNGTYVNGKAIERQWLRHGDTVDVGKYKIRFINPPSAAGLGVLQASQPGVELSPSLPPRTPPVAPALASTHAPVLAAAIRMLSGAGAGREVALTKVVTTIGKPGVAVAAITRRQHGYVLAHVEGADMPLHNGNPIGKEPVPLQHGDVLALADTEMQFVQNP